MNVDLTAPSAPPAATTRWPHAALASWFVATAVLAGYLLGAHVAGLPLPGCSDRRLLDGLASRHRAGRPLAVHVLYADCECSNRVLARLEARTPREDVDERIVLVEPHESRARLARLAEREGFTVERVPPEALPELLGLSVAPVLVATDSNGDLAYLGGYTPRKQSEVVETDRVLDQVVAGERPEALPVLGCAVTEELREATDPWRLR
jgi:hypothetical protein